MRIPEYFIINNPDNFSFNGITIIMHQSNEDISKNEIILDQNAFIFVKKGHNIIYCPNYKDKLIINTNNGIFLKKGNYIISFLTDNFENKYENYMIFLNDDIISQIILDYKEIFNNRTKFESQCSLYTFSIDSFLNDNLRSISTFFLNKSLYKNELLFLKIRQIFLNIMNTDSNFLFTNLIKKTMTELSDLKSYMTNNYTEPILIEDFAKKTNRSLTKFKNDFKTVFNDTPKKWINKKRLEKALFLLTSSSMSVTDICFLTGFQDISYFISLFKKEFGYTPNRIRNNNSGQQ